VPLDVTATPVAQKVYLACRKIPRGETRTYAEIADQAGTSPRGAARILACNPVLLAIPCHRVVPSAGGLGGFAGGVPLKEALLAFEKAVPRLEKEPLRKK